MKPLISIIVAISENRVIGEKGHIPWHLPEDLKRFKQITQGHPIIMGRKTHESIGKVLPGRTNIIITRDKNYTSPNCVIVHSLEEAIEVTHKEIPSEIFVIGGAQIYEQAIIFADKLYLTVTHQTIEGDAYFPDYSRFRKIIHESHHKSGKYNFTFLELVPEN